MILALLDVLPKVTKSYIILYVQNSSKRGKKGVTFAKMLYIFQILGLFITRGGGGGICKKITDCKNVEYVLKLLE